MIKTVVFIVPDCLITKTTTFVMIVIKKRKAEARKATKNLQFLLPIQFPMIPQ